jgi:hypothetical protein
MRLPINSKLDSFSPSALKNVPLERLSRQHCWLVGLCFSLSNLNIWSWKLICMSNVICDNHVPQWWVEFDDELNWLFTKRFRAFYLFPNPSQNFCYSHSLNFHLSGSTKFVGKQPTQLIVQLNSSLRHIIVTISIPNSQTKWYFTYVCK